MACEESWESVRDDVIVFCEDLLMAPLGLDPIMCNGSITLQGPHVSNRLYWGTKDDFVVHLWKEDDDKNKYINDRTGSFCFIKWVHNWPCKQLFTKTNIRLFIPCSVASRYIVS